MSWGLLGLATDGIRRPLLVVDRSRRVLEVSGLDAAASGQPASGIAVTTRHAAPTSLIDLIWQRDTCDDTTELTIEQTGEAVEILVALANTSGQACGGLPSRQGVTLVLDGLIDPADVLARRVLSR